MSKSVALLLALVFLSGTFVIIVEPVSAADLGSWTTKASVPEAEGIGGAAVVNGKIYVIGDLFTYEYDPATDGWVEKTAMPTPRTGFGVAAFQNKIYVIGGSSGWTQESGPVICGLNEVYDPSTDTWETKTSMPTAREVMQANAVNGKIYLIGGISSAGVEIADVEVWAVNEVYDIDTDTWNTKQSMPHPVYGGGSAVVDDKIYIISNLTQIYDPESDSWGRGASPPTVVSSGAAVCATTGVMAPTRIYAIGGLQSMDINQVYNPKNDTWTLGAPMLTPRAGLNAVVVNDIIYAIGGIQGWYPYLDTNEQYTPIGYGTSDPPDYVAAPAIVVSSPENKTYYSTNVTLCFVVNELTSQMRYSLDGSNNVTVASNTTLVGLPVGTHNVTVYAWDTAGNAGASETIIFTIAEPEPEPEPFPIVPVVTASAGSIVIVGVTLLVYLKKHKKRAEYLTV
jgi:N-acetylneuraminic acid mutarotase